MLRIAFAMRLIDNRCRDRFHQPVIHIRHGFLAQQIWSRILPQRDRKSGNMQQRQLFAKLILIKLCRSHDHAPKIPAAARHRDQSRKGACSAGIGPLIDITPAKMSGRSNAKRNAIVPPAPKPAKKIRCGRNIESQTGLIDGGKQPNRAPSQSSRHPGPKNILFAEFPIADWGAMPT